MEKKNHVGMMVFLTIIIIVLILAVDGLCYYIFLVNKEETKNTTAETKSEIGETENTSKSNNSEKSKTSSSPKYLDENKDIVYSYYNKMGSEYSYSLPYINIDSEDAQAVNNKIKTEYESQVEELVNSATYSEPFEMKYTTTQYDNILSVVLYENYSNNCKHYEVFNFDIYTGEQLSNTDLLSSRNITAESFSDQLKSIYEKAFIDLRGTEASYNTSSATETGLYAEQFNNTITNNTYEVADIPMFLSGTGTIHMIVDVYSFAGAGYYEEIIDTKL